MQCKIALITLAISLFFSFNLTAQHKQLTQTIRGVVTDKASGAPPAVGNNGISIHGNAHHLLQWRLEDIEIPNLNHYADISTLGGGILSALSSNVMGNSDFFTGAFPAEYGNAVSGVFDMKMCNGNNQKYEHTFQAGIFSVWGSGLIDKYNQDFDTDIQKWESIEDRQITKADQVMGAGGFSHRFFSQNGLQWKTTLAATYSKHNASPDISDYSLNITPYMSQYNKYTNIILKSSVDKKFSLRFTNSTGFTYTKLLLFILLVFQ